MRNRSQEMNSIHPMRTQEISVCFLFSLRITQSCFKVVSKGIHFLSNILIFSKIKQQPDEIQYLICFPELLFYRVLEKKLNK